jgi:hypothetical protein
MTNPDGINQFEPSDRPPEHDAGGRYAPAEGGLSHDRLLDRSVVLEQAGPAEAEALLGKARFLARLDHPALDVVLDCRQDAAGAQLIRRPLRGPSLAEAIALAAAGNPPVGIASPADVARLFLGLVEAVSAAHQRGVVHGALDAGCVRLGEHGEIGIGSWDGAMASTAHPVTQRFVAAAQPSAASATDGRHADVRALGRMLLAAARRRSGDEAALGEVSPAERKLLPVELERIARHAADSDAAAGYQNAGELHADLRAFLAGRLPPASARASDRVAWWLRQRRGLVLSGLFAMMAVIAAVWLVAGGDFLERLHWRTVVEERFEGAGLPSDWVEKTPGSFVLQQGAATSIAEREAVLVYRHRLSAPVVVEYEARVEAGAQPADLSVVWSEAENLGEHPGRLLSGRALLMQLGAFDNSFSAIIDKQTDQRLDYASWHVEAGKTYRVRTEIGIERVSVTVDGKCILQGRSMRPTNSGYVALYAYYPGKSFSDLRILQPRIPTSVSPLSGAHAVAAIGMHDEAAKLYGDVADAAPGTPVGEEALYRRGLAERNAGRMDAARGTWARIRDSRWAGLADCHVLEDICASWQHARFPGRFSELYRQNPEIRYDLRTTWQACVRRLVTDQRRETTVVDAYLKLREELFPDDGSSRNVAAFAYIMTKRAERVLESFADDHQMAALAMLILGRTDELLASPWAIADDRWHAHLMRGEYQQALALPRQDPVERAKILAKLGRFDEALMVAPGSPEVFILCGQPERAFARGNLTVAEAHAALICAGRLAEASGTGIPNVPGTGNDPLARLLLGLPTGAAMPPSWDIIAAAEAKDAAAVQVAIDAIPPLNDRSSYRNVFARAVIAPMALRAIGQTEEPQRTWRNTMPQWQKQYGQRIWYLMSYVLGGQADFSQLPAQSEAEAWSLLGRALRAELAGNARHALGSYEAFSTLPMHKRLLNGHLPDGDVEGFVAWRRRALEVR